MLSLSRTSKLLSPLAAGALIAIPLLAPAAVAQEKKPNILFIVSDDTGYGDLGPYGGGEAVECRRPTSIRWPTTA